MNYCFFFGWYFLFFFEFDFEHFWKKKKRDRERENINTYMWRRTLNVLHHSTNKQKETIWIELILIVKNYFVISFEHIVAQNDRQTYDNFFLLFALHSILNFFFFFWALSWQTGGAQILPKKTKYTQTQKKKNYY